MLAAVHAADGYPLRWPADPAAWLTPDHLLAAWVTTSGHRGVIGHVALCRAAEETGAPVWSAAAGVPADHIAAVARLFVAPGARGFGIGELLLGTACAWAEQHDLVAALEVLDRDRHAVALYERLGWRRVASAIAPWSAEDGAPVLLHHYLAPE